MFSACFPCRCMKISVELGQNLAIKNYDSVPLRIKAVLKEKEGSNHY